MKISTERIGELVVVDTVGPLPVTDEDAVNIFTAVDHYSKYEVAIPYTNKSANSTIDFIKNHVLKALPTTTTILSTTGWSLKQLKSNL